MPDNTLGREHIDNALIAEAPTPMYRWHKFWTRKPQNVVREYIERYSAPGDLVLDPFSGSGVTTIEALRTKRRALAFDILPSAIDVLTATVEHADVGGLDDAFAQVAREVRSEIEAFYTTRCRKCAAAIPAVCFAWGSSGIDVRYRCPNCQDVRSGDCDLDDADKKLIDQLDIQTIPDWYPRNSLAYTDGSPFVKGEGHGGVDDLFTRRNLRALAALLRAIRGLSSSTDRFFMRMAFESVVHLASKLTPLRDARPFAAFWAQHSFWIPPDGYMEMNVWQLFESGYRGRQGLRSAKAESNQDLGTPRRANSYAALAKGSADYLAICAPSLIGLKKIPADSIDYVFTDPPYGGSIQFGELSYLWLSWADEDLDEAAHLGKLVDYEVILNEAQNKDFDRYYSLLYATFQEVYRVLKPGRYMTVTFHNPKIRIRNATIRAAVFSGFEYEKIVYQPPAISSYKSLLQPFGSADGDFFFRFLKPSSRQKAGLEEADAKAFERVVVEATKQILAERGEPTPYTYIITHVDPVLAKHGYFLSLNPEIEIDDVLREHSVEGAEFTQVESKMGGVSGYSWWFQDENVARRLRQVPLSERVEGTLLRLLQKRNTISFTDALNAVFTQFPNSMTPDTSDVKAVLEQYAEPTRDGFWRLSRTLSDEQSAHSEMVYLLGKLGKALRYEVWIGRREQSESWLMTKLADLNTHPRLDVSDLNTSQRRRLENVDVVWSRKGRLRALFEVEHTTMLTEALLRCAEMPGDPDRFMILPASRNTLLHRKLSSPMFKEMFERDAWHLMYFDDLRALAAKPKEASVAAMIERSGLRELEPEIQRPKSRRRGRAEQLRLDSL
jgi:DNA modification methylase